MPLSRILDRLFAIDLRSLAAFRIGIGFLVLVDLGTRSFAIEQHYSDAGILPREAYARLLAVSDWQWTLHLWTGSVAGQSALFLCAAAAACALIAGYRTRTATVVSWVLLVSLQVRNPMVLYGADQLLRLLLFWAMFLPLGSAWSIDRRRAAASDPTPARHLSMASAALLLQPCVMYLFSGLLKSNASWQSGGALAHALSSEMYVTTVGRALANAPSVVSMLGPVVPWIEILAPLPLLMPWRTSAFRKFGLALLVVFHLAIGSALHTGMFPLVVFVALVPFVPTDVWDRLGIGGFADFDAPVGVRGSVPSSFARWRAIAAQAVVAALFVYALAWNVVGLGVEPYAAQQGLAWMKEWWSRGRTGIPLSFRDYAVERRMGDFGWIGRVTGLYQRWDMFERVGTEIRGRPVIVGTLADGQTVDLVPADAPAEAGSPAPESALAFYPGTRWLVYFTYLRTSGTQAARELLPAVVARDWERRNPGRKLESLQVSFVQPEVDDGKPAKVEVWYDGPANGGDRSKIRPSG